MHNSYNSTNPNTKHNKHKLTLIWSYSYGPRSGNEVAPFGDILVNTSNTLILDAIDEEGARWPLSGIYSLIPVIL